jgi:hypothetical protein
VSAAFLSAITAASAREDVLFSAWSLWLAALSGLAEQKESHWPAQQSSFPPPMAYSLLRATLLHIFLAHRLFNHLSRQFIHTRHVYSYGRFTPRKCYNGGLVNKHRDKCVCICWNMPGKARNYRGQYGSLLRDTMKWSKIISYFTILGVSSISYIRT